MSCPDCGAPGYSPFALWCTKCGAVLRLRRPRVEVVPALPARVRRVDSTNSEPNQNEGPSPEVSVASPKTEASSLRPTGAPNPLESDRAEKLSASSPNTSIGEPSRANEGFLRDYLIINRAEIVRMNCAACGGPLIPSIQGKILFAAQIEGVGDCLFCTGCGDNIMSHVASDEPPPPYLWEWAFSLRAPANQ